METVRAAGGVLWREAHGERQVAVVHRPRYDDWSLPKGKTKKGESLLVTALREVEEETGHLPLLGPFLARNEYRLSSGALKEVFSWSLRVRGGRFVPNDEVDELLWLSPSAARRRLSYAEDRSLLQRLAEAPGWTRTVAVVRNARRARGARSAGDTGAARGARSAGDTGAAGAAVVPGAQADPLDARGRRQAEGLVSVLAALAPSDLLCAPSARSWNTLLPSAEAASLPLRADPRLGRDGEPPSREALDALALEVLENPRAPSVVLCLHGRSVPALLAALAGGTSLAGFPSPAGFPSLAEVASPAEDAVPPAPARGAESPDARLRPGGCWLVHLAGTRVVACERHHPHTPSARPRRPPRRREGASG